MSPSTFDFALAIGGAAGQGIATPGNLLSRILVRRGLHLNAYNAYQSIIRGGHIFLTIRASTRPALSHGDRLDMLVCLNQDTMDRHLRLMRAGTHVVFNRDSIEPHGAAAGVHLCGLPVKELTHDNRNKLVQNTVAIGAIVRLLGLEFAALEAVLTQQFGRKGQGAVAENAAVARAGYDWAAANCAPIAAPVPDGRKPLAVWSGNEALAMGGAAAGVKFYAAYPMSPASGVLHWMAKNARELGIMVRQMEDEIAVANVAIGAAHTGVRAMCATSGGGFALMTEAVGAAAMMEVPLVFINVQRAGPSTGVPTKTEQGDLWQVLGASPGDFPRLIVAPRDALDAFRTVPLLFNLADQFQCPGIVLSDLLISEGTFSVDPADLDLRPEIDRGKLITAADGRTAEQGYLRYQNTADGVSPRALPGVPGHMHVVATDEHDEDGGLISDEFTDARKRRMMVEKRARKMTAALARIAPPELEGPADAEVTLIGWGSTHGVIAEAVRQLAAGGIRANHLHIRWLVPFHAEAVRRILARANKTIVVENNHSGQFFRYLRSETGISADRCIRKYDGEPFLPHHVADGTRELLAGDAEVYVPEHEITV